MPEKKYVRYLGGHDEVEAFPPLSGGVVRAKRGERVEVTPEQHAEMTSGSGGSLWEDATDAGRTSGRKE